MQTEVQWDRQETSNSEVFEESLKNTTDTLELRQIVRPRLQYDDEKSHRNVTYA